MMEHDSQLSALGKGHREQEMETRDTNPALQRVNVVKPFNASATNLF